MSSRSTQKNSVYIATIALTLVVLAGVVILGLVFVGPLVGFRLAAVTTGQTTSYPITIQVNDHNGYGISQAQVTIAASGSSTAWYGYTDAYGSVTYYSQTSYASSYDITVIKNGYNEAVVKESGSFFAGGNTLTIVLTSTTTSQPSSPYSAFSPYVPSSLQNLNTTEQYALVFGVFIIIAIALYATTARRGSRSR
ncbi:MAG: hypothetical protein E6L03_09900 [Thaumarchaeota archaeon]|nr:MAG: hypothetical protein E6L03_09900 [Nitrososphaerota archaeon]